MNKELAQKIADIASATAEAKAELYKLITSQVRDIIKGEHALDDIDGAGREESEKIMGIDFRKGGDDFIPDSGMDDTTIIGIVWDEESAIPFLVCQNDLNEVFANTPITDDELTMSDLMQVSNLVMAWANEGL